jgi:hypothetical protein
MNDIIIPILKTNFYSKNPEKINNNTFKFFAEQDYDILPEASNTISSGFYLKNILFQIIPTDIYKTINCLANSFISEDSLLAIKCYCYEELINNKYTNPFAQRRKKLEKDACIFYLSIVSSKYEENYILDIIN